MVALPQQAHHRCYCSSITSNSGALQQQHHVNASPEGDLRYLRFNHVQPGGLCMHSMMLWGACQQPYTPVGNAADATGALCYMVSTDRGQLASAVKIVWSWQAGTQQQAMGGGVDSNEQARWCRHRRKITSWSRVL
jgi:hypothetical protein